MRTINRIRRIAAGRADVRYNLRHGDYELYNCFIGDAVEVALDCSAAEVARRKDSASGVFLTKY